VLIAKFEFKQHHISTSYFITEYLPHHAAYPMPANKNTKISAV